MSEITVVKTLEEKPLSREEREVLYQEISKSMHIPYIYFEELARLEDLQAAHEIRSIRPELPILMVHKILAYPAIIPIVSKHIREMQSVTALQQYYNMPVFKFGGAIKALRKPGRKNRAPRASPKAPQVDSIGIESDRQVIVRQQEAEVSARALSDITPEFDLAEKNAKIPQVFSLQYQTTSPIDIIYIYDLNSASKYRVDALSKINLCGFAIDTRALFEKFYTDETPANMGIRGRLRSGYYDEAYLHFHIMLALEITKFYKANITDFAKGTAAGDYIYILFPDEKSMHKILIHLQSVLWYLLNRVQASFTDNMIEIVDAHIYSADPKNLKKPSVYYNTLSQLLKFIVPIEKLVEEIPARDETSEALIKIAKIFKIKGLLLPDSLAIMFDMSANKLLDMWMIIRYLIFDAPLADDQKKDYDTILQNHVELVNRKFREQAQVQANNIAGFDESFDELVKRWIFIRKFGYAKFAEIMPNRISDISHVLMSREKIFSHISKREQDLLVIEHARWEKFREALANSRAPWISIVQKLRVAPLEEKKKLFHSLEKYIGKAKTGAPSAKLAEDFIRSPEGFPIICPHVIDEIKMEIEGKSDYFIHDFLLKYAGDTPLYDAYYCKICGEVLTYTDEMTGLTLFEGAQPTLRYHDDTEVLNDFIWKYAAQIVRGYVEFSNVKTGRFVNDFITGIVSSLFDFIVLIEKKLRKSKTTRIEEIDDRRKFYTIIYVWAALAKIIIDNPKKIRFNFQKEYKEINPAKLLALITEKFLSTQNILIRHLRTYGIEESDSAIGETISSAFANINAIMTKARLSTPKPIDITQIIRTDPIFLYMLLAHILHEHPKNIKQLIAQYDVDIKTILHTEPIEIGDWYGAAKLAKIPAKSAEAIYFTQSYETFFSYIQSRVYEHSIYIVKITRDPENENLYDIRSKFSNELIQLREKNSAIMRADAEFLHARIIMNLNAFAQIPSYDALYAYAFHQAMGYATSALGRIYGMQFNHKLNMKSLPESIQHSAKNIFHKHAWKIYVYVDIHKFRGYNFAQYAPKDLHYYTSEEIRKNAMPQNLILIDLLCAICYHTLSNVTQEIDALADIEKEQQLINFFNYYQNRCPIPSKKQIQEGNYFHTFEKDKCVNCGATREGLLQRDNAYYKKYIDIFLRDQKRIEDEKHIVTTAGPTHEKLQTTKIPAFMHDWKFNPSIINEVITKTVDLLGKIKPAKYRNIWMNLGICENYDYDKIISGAENPSKNVNESKNLSQMRINHIDIYIKELIFDYYLLINYKNMPTLPLEIKVIIDVGTATELEQLRKFGDFNTYLESSYEDLVEAAREIFTYTNLANFLMELLIRAILGIRTALDAVSKKMANTFIAYIIAKIIQMERATALMKEQKAAAIEATQKTDPNADPNMVDNRQSTDFDDLVAPDAVDKFSYEGMDYDGQNDDY